MEIEIGVLLGAGESVTDALGIEQLQRGQALDLGDEILVRYLGTEAKRDSGELALLLFALSFPMGVASSMVARRVSELLDRGSRRREQLMVSKRIVRTTTTEIEEVVRTYQEAARARSDKT